MAYRIKTSDEAIKTFGMLLRLRSSESAEDMNFRQTSSGNFEGAGERLEVERLSISSCSSALLNARKVRLNACCLF